MTTLLALLVALLARIVPNARDVPNASDTPPHADLTVTASEYRVQVAATTAGGWRTVRLHNAGTQYHHVLFLRVRDRRAADSVVAMLSRRDHDWDTAIPGATSIGGAEGSLVGSRPGDDTYATIDLEPGLYLVLCTIPTGGRLHVARGMHTLLTVTPSPARTAPPRADATLHEMDYAYRLTPQRLAPGWRLIEVVDDGPSEHIAEFARLAPGTHLADVARANADTRAPDPVRGIIGGAPRVARGGRTFAWLHLTPGAYVVQCWLDTPNAKPHAMQGMIAELEVR